VVLVGWDGADYRRVSQLLSEGRLPNLAQVTAFGTFQQLTIEEDTGTKPSWTTQLTGLPMVIHGTTRNRHYTDAPPGRTVFEVLHANGLQSSYVAGKCVRTEPGGRPTNRGNMCLGIDPQGKPYPFLRVPDVAVLAVADKHFTMAEATDHCLEGLAAVGATGFAFCHYQWPDFVGHHFGGRSAEYDQALIDLDTELGRIAAAAGIGSDVGTLLLLSSDHGFEQAGDPEESNIHPNPARTKRQFGFAHQWQPRAILGSNTLLRSPATGRDMFKTILDALGRLDLANAPDGRSLLVH
jgi:hypothetical protein